MQPRSLNNAQGIDVSHHNGSIDWPKVAADGISFAFLKASEGQTFRDDTFADHLKAARAAGVLVGAYHFVKATTETAAKAEAANFANAIAAAGGVELLDLPPVMDYENNPAGLPKTLINVVAMAFLVELERLTGRKPMIYTGSSFASNFGPLLSTYPLWIARYSVVVPADTAAWSKWTIWQYSDGAQGGTRKNGTRKVAGISGNVDLNEYAGTLADLQLAFGKKTAPAIAAEIVPKVVRMEGNVVIATGEIVDGRLVAPIADVLKAANVPFTYDNETKKLYLL